MNDDPIQIVRGGYDRVSRTYRPDNGDGPYPKDYWTWVQRLALPATANVLDLGCGCGRPVAQLLAGRTRYVGIDLSPVQLDRARAAFPDATFRCADMRTVAFAAGAFDAVIALYSIIHVPRSEQPGLFERMARWLRRGGQLLATVGATAWSGIEEDWLGVSGASMYWSHADAHTYRRWLRDCGFDIVRDAYIAEGEGGHQLLHAVKK